MNYIDVCSGISAPTVAWKPLGWRALCYAEIEAAPHAVLAHHYPDTPLRGDFTEIKGDEYGPVDLLVGGTPCQDFSVAGLRAGLDGERGNLSLEYLRLADRARPRWLVWENVPGVLSIDGGRAFGAILGGLAELGYGFAYRILDAQHFGVPQRRRRVFVVGYLGDWRRAAAVLFERQSLSGNPAPRREKGSRITGAFTPGAHPGGFNGQDAYTGHLIPAGIGNDYQTARSLTASHTATGRLDPSECTLIAFGGQMSGTQASAGKSDLCPSLQAKNPMAIAIQERAVSENLENGPGGKGWQEDKAYTLEARNKVQAVAFQPRIGRNGRGYGEDVFPALNGADAGATSDMRPCVAFMENVRAELRVSDATDATDALACGGGKPGQGYAAAMIGLTVRRLTPRECERLQGFGDDFTLVPYRKGMMADGPRYKMLGNSMAVPVMRWIGERIAMVDALIHSATFSLS